jgi:hypothetical protein
MIRKLVACITIAIVPLVHKGTPVHAHSGGLDSSGCHGGSQPYHCHGGSSDSGSDSLGSGWDSDWVDVVPRLRIPNISINLGRIIPSVSIGSPVRWGFKVPYSFTPRIRFMKFQVYFDPDFDYFVRKAGWITLAAMKAVGDNAEVQSEMRAGTHKYRVQSPQGGGFASWTSDTSVERVKGIRTKGILTLTPSSIFEEEQVNLNVKLENTRGSRDIHLLTAPSCTDSTPWRGGRGPAPGWEVVSIARNLTTEQHRERFGRDFVVSNRTSTGAWRANGYTDASQLFPVQGRTFRGEWTFTTQLAASDNNRCFAAVAPATGPNSIWVSNIVRAGVATKTPTSLRLNQANLESDAYVNSVISGSVTGDGPRTISADICGAKSPEATTTTSDSTGKFSLNFKRTLLPGAYKVCVTAPKTRTFHRASAEVAIAVSRTTLSGSVSISTTSINTGQQFTVSGSITPYVANKQVWIRVYCSGATNYPTGWAAQTYVKQTHSTTGNPTGYDGLDYYDSSPITYSVTKLTVDSSGNFTKTFTSNTPGTCIYGAYTPATDYHTAWLSDPTSAITVQ